MAFTRFSTNVQNITALPNKVTGQASTLKQTFDKAGVDIKTALNALMTELEATASASSLGATSTTTVSTTIQGIISAFDTAIAARYTSTQTDTAISSATNNLVTSITFEPTTGVFTITKKDGTTTTIDTAIEKVPASFTLIESGGSYYLRITNLDGTYTQTDVTSLMNIYNFNNSDTIAFTKTTVGNVHTMSASIRNNSITMEMLGLSALTSIQGYVHQASDYATNAGTSATNANNSATSARSWAEGGTNTRTGEDTDNAKYYATQAGLSATDASGSATTASGHATTAGTKAGEASASATNASTSATTATNKATLSESWAVGGTGTRGGEDTNNAKYWSEQAQAAAQGGDMLKSVYDTDNDGVVDNAKALNGHADTYFQQALISGANIKTVNGNNILGSGNIDAGGVTILEASTTNVIDFNDLTTAGYYLIKNASSLTTLNLGNMVGTSAQDIPLIVQANESGSITQAILTMGRYADKKRDYVNNSWSAWQQLLRIDDIQNLSTTLYGKVSISNHVLGEKVLANATSVQTLANSQVRNIYAGTTDMTAGTTALTTGDIYVCYEA